jgi:anti-sigma factor RsiW
VEHRHLLPDEFEEIIDGEAGESTAALREHLEQCDECKAELAKRHELSTTLEHLVHHGPAPLFSYRVMSQVQVFEPWHVALRDSVRRLVPRTRAARWFAGITAIFVASLLTVAGIWAALNTESAWLFAEVGVKRTRAAVLGSIKGALETVFGRDALNALEGTGMMGTLIAASIVIGVILVAAIAFRVVALASRRRRS